MESFLIKPVSKAVVAGASTALLLGVNRGFKPSILGGEIKLSLPLVAAGVAFGTGMFNHAFTNWVLPHLAASDNKMKNRESAAVSLAIAGASEPLAFYALDQGTFQGFPMSYLVAIGISGEIVGNLALDFVKGEDLDFE